LSTTTYRNDRAQTFCVSHPFHPLYQQEYELIDRHHNWGEDRVNYLDARGDLKSIPTRYTNIYAQDPFVSIAQDRAYFRTEDLLALIG
jgi:hypothetical protein